MKTPKVAATVFMALLLSTSTVYCCSTWDWIKCGAIVAACAASCVDPADGVCEACLGSLYNQCVSCIRLKTELASAVSVPGLDAQEICCLIDYPYCVKELDECERVCDLEPISPSPCIECIEDYERCVHCGHEVLAPLLQNGSRVDLGVTKGSCSAWDWVKCAAKVAECAATCASSGITSQECISCFGSSYNQCKGCIGIHTTIQGQQDVLEGCSTSGWLRCAGQLAQCTGECIRYGVRSPQCFHCLGSSYDDCINCISDDDMDDIRQLAEEQRGISSSGTTMSQNSLGLLMIAVTGVVLKGVVPF